MARTTKKKFNLSEHNRTVLGYLVRPSWLSGFLAVVVSLSVVIGIIIASHYNGSTLQQLFDAHTTATNTSVSSTSEAVSNNFSTNVIVSDVPLFIFWAGVGLVVYSLAANIVKALGGAVDLEEEMHYVNLNQRELLRTQGERLAIRIAILLLWLVFMRYTAHVILPYAISLVHVSIESRGSLAGSGYPLAAICLLAVCLHLHTIFLRMLLFKPRVFWQSAYD
jgi:hypothetical protein